MSKKRLAAGTALVLLLASVAAGASVTANAKPAKTESTVKLGFITKFPVDFYFTLVGGAKQWQKTHKNVKVVYAQGKSATDDAGEIAAIQNMVASGVKGIAITPTSAAVIPALKKAVKSGVKVVGCENTMSAFKLDKAEMRSSIGYVPAGITELMLKQQEGWSYVRP